MRFKFVIIFSICLNLILCASPQKKAEQKNEKDPHYHYNMGLFYLNNGELDNAIQHLKKSLTLNPKYSLSLSALGLAYSMKGNLEESVKYFQKCLEVNPKFAEAHNYLGAVYQEMGFIDKSAEEYRAALSDENYKSKELPYYNLARLYLIQDKLEEALGYIEKSIELNKRLAMAHNIKGAIMEKLVKFEQAIVSYKEAVKIVPDDINFNFNLAVAYYKNGNFKDSKKVFEIISSNVFDAEMKKKIEEYLNLINKKLEKK